MAEQRRTSEDRFTPAFLLHLYDELTESKPNVTLKDYENFLILWGMDRKKARGYCSQISSHKSGRFTREELCGGLGFLPEQPAGLREVEILYRDMPIRKSESIQVIVLNALNSNSSKKNAVAEIKREVEKIYGPKWNVFIANGQYWGVCTHRPGGNLVFTYQGVVYGVYHSPERCTDESTCAAISSTH
ncbi:Antigen [Taenia solium]|eukprot:TsM_000566900 transcript=TsM_000566900 gene=TsM_000566900